MYTILDAHVEGGREREVQRARRRGELDVETHICIIYKCIYIYIHIDAYMHIYVCKI